MSTDFLNCKQFRVFPAPGQSIQCDEIVRFLKESTTSKLTGRKPLLEGSFQGKDCLVRWFYHGGVLRNVLKGRYVGSSSRAVEELKLLTVLKEMGLPVVTPLFALTEGRAIGYRQAIATERLDNAQDLAILESISEHLLASLIELLERFFDAGLYHPDLNIKNILLVPDSEELFLLDFDRAVLLNGSLAPVERKRIYERLFRSFDKSGRLNVWDEFSFEAVPDYVGEAMGQYRKIRRIRAFFWKLNRK
jgi:3-deoxy-D-manno-octulosonic acid kinase